MNVYPDRIEELHDWLARRYGHKDKQATEILLASMLPESLLGRVRPWIILETDYPSRSFADAWFAFGDIQANVVRSLSTCRVVHARQRFDMLQAWIGCKAAGQAGLLVEPEWRTLPYAGPGNRMLTDISSYKVLLSSCVRLRVQHPKGHHNLEPMDVREADRRELARLAGRVMDSQMRASHASVLASARQQAKPPDSLAYWCELAQVIAPMQTDWEALTSGLIAIAEGISVLYNDGRPGDWAASERVLRDCIPYFTETLLWNVIGQKVGMLASTRALSAAGVDRHVRTNSREIKRLKGLGVLRQVASGEAAWISLLDRQKRILV